MYDCMCILMCISICCVCIYLLLNTTVNGPYSHNLACCVCLLNSIYCTGRPGGSVGNLETFLTLGREFESRRSHTNWYYFPHILPNR